MDNPKYSTTLFYYAIVDAKEYPCQSTITADDPAEYADRLSEMMTALATPDEFLSFKPREVSYVSAAGRGGSGGAGGSRPVAAGSGGDYPPCPRHGNTVTQKTNRAKGTTFVSCSSKNPDGSYCNWKPADA